MPAGLQVWDAQGRIVVDLTDRLAKVVASGSAGMMSPSNSTFRKSIPIAGMANDGTWFVQATEFVVVEIFSGYFRLSRFELYGGDNLEVFYTVIKQ